MQSEAAPGLPRVALIMEVPPPKDHVHAALREADIQVASESRAASLDPVALAGVDVVLVTLDEAIEPHLERVTNLVAGAHLPVVFDDCRVSRELSGWERNRWARHLFAKLTGSNDTRPPVPTEAAQTGPSSEAVAPVTPERSDSGEAPIWVLCASIGGPESVSRFLEALPQDVNAAFVLVQHMGVEFQRALVERLQRITYLHVSCAVNESRPGLGNLLVVPADKGFRVGKKGDVQLIRRGYTPAYAPRMDEVLRELVQYYAERVNAIIFSGKALDGVDGCFFVKRAGGQVLAQDAASATIDTTAEMIREAELVDFIGSPEELAEYVSRAKMKGQR